MRTLWIAGASASLLFLRGAMAVAQTTAPAPSIELKRGDRHGQLQVLIDGREAVAYQYAADLDFPHYGTFGPRRPDAQSGMPFVLKKGESLQQHVGILMHSGDATTRRVAERYQQ